MTSASETSSGSSSVLDCSRAARTVDINCYPCVLLLDVFHFTSFIYFSCRRQLWHPGHCALDDGFYDVCRGQDSAGGYKEIPVPPWACHFCFSHQRYSRRYTTRAWHPAYLTGLMLASGLHYLCEADERVMTCPTVPLYQTATPFNSSKSARIFGSS